MQKARQMADFFAFEVRGKGHSPEFFGAMR
jgi:hypothetical protein